MFFNIKQQKQQRILSLKQKVLSACAVVAATRVTQASCPPMDYTLVLGSESDIQSTSPIVALRLDPAGIGYGDALIASAENYGTKLTHYSMHYCKVMTRRSFNTNDRSVSGLAYLSNGRNPDAVMLSYDEYDQDKQILTVIRNPHLTDASFQTVDYHISFPNLRTIALSTPQNPMVSSFSNNSSGLLIWGSSSVQYLHSGYNPDWVRAMTLPNGSVLQDVKVVGQSIYSLAQTSAGSQPLALRRTNTNFGSSSTVDYQLDVLGLSGYQDGCDSQMDIFAASDTAETVFVAAYNPPTNVSGPNPPTNVSGTNTALIAIKMSKGNSWTIASKQASIVYPEKIYKLDIKATSENTMVAAFVTIVNSAALTVVQISDLSTGLLIQKLTQTPQTFSLSPIESQIRGKIMLRPGMTAPDELMLFGLQEVQENGNELYKAAFLMNAYKDSGRVSQYLDGHKEETVPPQDFPVSQVTPESLQFQLLKAEKFVEQEITSIDDMWSQKASKVQFYEEQFTQDKLRLWPQLESTPASQFVVKNSPPSYQGQPPMVVVAQVGERLRHDLEKRFEDSEGDYPLKFAGKCVFNYDPSLSPFDVFFDFSKNQMYSIKTMSQDYSGENCMLSYTVTDSRGFSNSSSPITVLISKDAARQRENLGSFSDQFRATLEVNMNNNAQAQSRVKDASVGQIKRRIAQLKADNTITTGKVSVDRQKTYSEVGESEVKISDKGVLSLVFGRELPFPQATLQDYVPTYVPTVPEVKFRITNIKRVVVLDQTAQYMLDQLNKQLVQAQAIKSSFADMSQQENDANEAALAMLEEMQPMFDMLEKMQNLPQVSETATDEEKAAQVQENAQEMVQSIQELCKQGVGPAELCQQTTEQADGIQEAQDALRQSTNSSIDSYCPVASLAAVCDQSITTGCTQFPDECDAFNQRAEPLKQQAAQAQKDMINSTIDDYCSKSVAMITYCDSTVADGCTKLPDDCNAFTQRATSLKAQVQRDSIKSQLDWFCSDSSPYYQDKCNEELKEGCTQLPDDCNTFTQYAANLRSGNGRRLENESKVVTIDEQQAELRAKEEQKFYDSNAPNLAELIKISVGPVDQGDLDIYTEAEKEKYSQNRKNAVSWEISSASTKGIDIKLIFKDTAGISKDFDEQVTLSTDFQNFEPNFPNNFKVPIPQLKRAAKKEELVAKEEQNYSQTQIAAGAFMATQLVLSGSLNQVWGMINGLQIFVHLPMLGVEFPGAAQDQVEYMIDIATLDLIPTGDIIEATFEELPDEDEEDLPVELQDTGFESKYFINNAGTLLLFFLVQIFFLVLLAVMIFCSRIFQVCKKPAGKMQSWLLYNPILRLLLEATLDFSFCVFIQQKLMQENQMEQESSVFEQMNNFMFWFFLVLFSAMPLAILVFLCYYFKDLKKQDMIDKYGSIYEGVKLENRSAIIYPLQFILRRYLFAVVSILVSDFIWLQIALQFLFTTFIVIYLFQTRPLEETQALRLEVFNEVTIAFLLYHVMSFSDWYYQDAEMKEDLGYTFSAIIFFNLAIHLTLLLVSQVRSCCDKCRRKECCCQKKRKNKAQTRVEQQQLQDDEQKSSNESEPAQRRAKNRTILANLIEAQRLEDIKESQSESRQSSSEYSSSSYSENSSVRAASNQAEPMSNRSGMDPSAQNIPINIPVNIPAKINTNSVTALPNEQLALEDEILKYADNEVSVEELQIGEAAHDRGEDTLIIPHIASMTNPRLMHTKEYQQYFQKGI